MPPKSAYRTSSYLTTCGLAVTLTFDLLSAKSNQLHQNCKGKGKVNVDLYSALS